ncbi:MAG TPA: peroxiredoxin [Polyangiaceae bacterium]|jgi:peroxiredoxin Q/BCP|nr:peroxiredoxin [Polyangiaceae bacterium]
MVAHIKAGDAAPQFDLESDAGTRLTLKDFAGKWLVLYFYPRDNTPGCTREAQGFSEAANVFKKLGAAVVGISKDSVKSHCGFRDKIGIRFPLLSDPDLVAHKAYAVWGTKVLYGREMEGTIRSTFLISPGGKIARVWNSVKVDGHVEAVVNALREGQAGEKKPRS